MSRDSAGLRHSIRPVQPRRAEAPHGDLRQVLRTACVQAGTAWLLLALCACQCGEKRAVLPDRRIESGFKVDRDAFAFPNFAGGGSSANLTAAQIVRMFGEERVCAQTGDGSCRLTPIARQFMKNVNSAMTGGRCEGFAVLSDLLFSGDLKPRAFGAEDARHLSLEGNEALSREIAYWFSSQYLREIVSRSTKALSGKEAVVFLAEEFAKPAHDMYRIGIARVDASGRRTGGHAVVPVAVFPTPTPNRYVIAVYDNNHPQTEREIVVDVAADRWEYQASSNPDEPAGLYAGDTNSRNPIYLAPARPRLGRHPCTFCKGDEAGEQALNQIFTFGSAEASATDEQGRVAGEVDGRLVGDIPGSIVMPVFSTEPWADRAPPQILLPSTGALSVELRPREGEGPAAVALFGAGSVTGVENAVLTEGQTQKLDVAADGSVTFTPSEGSSPVVFSAQETTDGTQVEARVRVPEEAGVSSVSVAVDRESGDVTIAATAQEPATLGVEVTKSSPDSQQDFAGDVPVPSGGSATLQVDEWQGGGEPLEAEVDNNGDGTPDETVPVTNSGDAPPDRPLQLAAAAQTHESIALTWQDASTTEESFELQRDDGTGFAALATLALNTGQTVDTDHLVHSKTYRYRIRAVNRHGASDWSDTAEATTPGCPAGTQDNDSNGSCTADCATAGLSCVHGACADASGTALCACETGYTGASCSACDAEYQDNDADGTCLPDCAASGLGTCSNHGTCSDASGTAACTCAAVYTGDTCSACAAGYQDNDADGTCLPDCTTSGLGTCSNRGACTDASGTAVCACAGGYAGETCGACAIGFQDNDANGTCLAVCATSGLGDCSGHGTCSDASGAAACACATGYTGDTCSGCAAGYQDSDSNGTCLPDCATSGLGSCSSHGTCSDATGTAACTCAAGYSGATCSGCAAGYQDNDADGTCSPTCATSGTTCSGHGECSDATGTAKCVCAAEYAGESCGSCAPGHQDGDADGTCAPDCTTSGLGNCSGHGACSASTGTARCTCTAGYTGDTCGDCAAGYQDFDANGSCVPACATSGLGNCSNHGFCADAGGTAKCVCTTQYAGETCGSCADGFQDGDTDGTCSPTCATSGLADCSGHGTCSDTGGTALCGCLTGYSGTTCNACAAGYQDGNTDGVCSPDCANSGLGTCSEHGACSDATGTATCVCTTEYTGETCGSCADGYQDGDTDGTCAPTCAKSGLGDCSGHGTCTDTRGTAVCGCLTGYAGDTCNGCAAGYQDANTDGTCSPDCANSGLGNCSDHGACSDATGTARCVCATEYAGETCGSCADGFQDGDTDGACSPGCATSGLGDCSTHGTCSDTGGTALCGCMTGYAGTTCNGCAAGYQDSNTDGTCSPDCATSGLGTCSNHGTCSDATGSATCACAVEYTGTACDSCAAGYQDGNTDGACAPDCTTSGLVGCSGHGTCSEATGTALCGCTTGYAGTTCSGCAVGYQDGNTDDTCAPDCATSGLGTCSNHGTCSEATGTATCSCAVEYNGTACDSCAAGYQDGNTDGTCAPNCATSGLGTCSDHGTCSDSSGTARCTCTTAYAGDACGSCADGYQDGNTDGTCMPTCTASGLGNCSGHGTCSEASGTATCTCDAAYTGAACNACAQGYQDNDSNGTCLATCATSGFGDCSGHGTCSDSRGTAACTCTTGYSGEACSACAQGYRDSAGTCVPIAELACDGADENLDGNTDEGCPAALRLVAPTTRSAEYGGPGPSTSFADPCPPDHVVVGASGLTKSGIESIQWICAPLVLSTQPGVVPYRYLAGVGGGAALPIRGTGGTDPFALACPADQVVTRVRGRFTGTGADPAIRALEIFCSSATLDAAPGQASATFSTPASAGMAGMETDDTFDVACPPDAAVTGTAGRVGSGLLSLRLDCLKLAPVADALCDHCGVCDSDPRNDCAQDCSGEWGGQAQMDVCGVCGGDGSSCVVVPTGPKSVEFGTVSETTVRGNAYGGTTYLDTCPTGQAAIGFDGRVSGYVTGIQVVCGILGFADAPPNWTATAAPGTSLSMRGINPGTSWSRRCPANTFVSSFSGRSGGLVDQLVFQCAPITFSGGGASFTTTIGTSTPLAATPEGTGGSAFAATPCSAGKIAVGAHIQAGDGLDGFGLRCAAPTAR